MPKRSWLTAALVTTLALGIAFRFIALDHKVWWHDEAYTSLRAAGYSSVGIGQAIFRNQSLPAPALQRYQQIKPGSTAADTVRSLAREDPQHPPLYFLMARGWMQWFGSSIWASRLLPVLLSLLGLVGMYGLGLELFGSPLVALCATALLAISPFDVLFAQVARQYSLLSAMVILSSWALLRALRLSTGWTWGVYAFSLAVGLYTQPFFGLTLAAQGVYGVFRIGFRRALLPLIGSMAWAIILYAPWIGVMIANFQRALDTTSWASGASLVYFLKLWTLSFTALFFDLDLGFDHPGTYLLRLPLLGLIGAALYTVWRRTPWPTWLFVWTSIGIPFCLLAGADLLLDSRRSAVSRYLIACFPGVQLAVGYFLSRQLAAVRGRIILAVLLAGSVASCTVSALSETWWNRVPSYFNAEIARIVNRGTAPLLLSDTGADLTNLGELISLSYRLRPEVRLLLLGQPPDLTQLNEDRQTLDRFVFRPSGPLRQALAAEGWLLTRAFDQDGLWRLTRPPGTQR
jgi:uncharacterized membrane protein